VTPPTNIEILRFAFGCDRYFSHLASARGTLTLLQIPVGTRSLPQVIHDGTWYYFLDHLQRHGSALTGRTCPEEAELTAPLV
jgi:hypothetical protein